VPDDIDRRVWLAHGSIARPTEWLVSATGHLGILGDIILPELFSAPETLTRCENTHDYVIFCWRNNFRMASCNSPSTIAT
jgi:hypothetical protein